jgi:putative SOS response-associated peptidase YedK
MESFPIDEVDCDLIPNMEVSPAKEIYVIIRSKGRNRLDKFHWGLVPGWAANAGGGNRMINARLETVADKPSFRESFRKRRCLIPAEGFYEWCNVDDKKLPIFITLPDRKPFAFAGLWETWQSGDGRQPVYKSCTIITTRAVAAFRPFHHRMPVILKPEVYEYWLDTENHNATGLTRLLQDDIITEFVSQQVLASNGIPPSAGISHKKKSRRHQQLKFTWSHK